LRLSADDVSCLATIISDDIDVMCARLRRIASLRAADDAAKQAIAGIHIEGPFLNAADGYRGAHPRAALHPADVDEMARLLDAADDLTRLVTLAPECDPQLRVTRLLASRGVVVSAGHTDASLDRLDAAIDAGLSMCTHVGNACPMQLPRHDNIIQRMLSLAGRLWLCFIGDGVHVPFVALRNYVRLAGLDRVVIVSDAMAGAGLGPGAYTLGRWTVTIGADLAARSPDGSHLIGSAMPLPRAADRLAAQLGLSDADLARITSINPRRAVGL
jgi:N-acetylglucosamine-6-phosphate deacetylase